ncbi:MAG: MCE family protein, partial [Candidatus Dadabacteria bacterium]|nr:MCE family protein [Candidatus Dadabacteria bacterium]
MSKEIQLGIFFFIALVILGVVFELLNGIPFLQRHYTLKTYFSAIGELKPGNPVKLAGLEVGKVSAVKLGNNNIAVEIEIERGTPVKKDSVATI